MREGALRHGVRVRDIDNLTSPDARVEMTFRLGDQLYAVEHTGVEPFDGFLENQNRAPAIFDPIKDALNGALDPDGIFELNIPFDCFSGCKMPEVRVLQAALIEWVKTTAPTLQVNRYGRYRGLKKMQPAGVPFVVSLVRFERMGHDGRFQLAPLVNNSQAQRNARMQRACDKKFPKLATWKRSDNARTILVLEDNSVFTPFRTSCEAGTKRIGSE